MRYNKLRISTEATSKLRSIRQRTGVTPNLLCRTAIMLSLEEGPAIAPAPDEGGQEFNAYTLTGEYTGLIAALLRFVEEDEGGASPLSNEDLVARLRAHIHRGVGTLSVRAKSAADLGRLVLAA
ncbi:MULTISPECIES: DNA sulfur modification protein DndE [Mesorhizobium]|uniref:DNA sulfur modification protein DndE n=1 Tax=Mesorhizobium humile TaxID=3072313 RepID=A0ABU4YN44_9HYPH|nr:MULTISPECIES: DNA sulfur modification protein DndE [unclassified Mesorhizobium]MDX8463284.1 DNA sulfur modification protein DndE [Mesorhizobium sp. VK2D]MDX8488372.1 DNA sulfur modification protein DndE [Mesorhizobium sp. VK2B]